MTWSSDTGKIVEGSGGKTLDNLLDDRANAVKKALMDMGVPESQIQFGSRPLYRDLDGTTSSAFKLEFKEN